MDNTLKSHHFSSKKVKIQNKDTAVLKIFLLNKDISHKKFLNNVEVHQNATKTNCWYIASICEILY